MSDVKFRSDVTVELREAMGDEALIVDAARVSTDKRASEFSEDANNGLIRALVREGHGTPFEYPELVWYLEVPIFVSRQIVKHRLSTINEHSGRYSEMAPEFYLPTQGRPVIQVGKTMNYEFEDSGTEESQGLRADVQIITQDANLRWWREYQEMRALGIAKEVARIGAPTNLYSRMFVKMNLRSTLHFIAQRTEFPDADRVSHPQYEIQLVAKAMAAVVSERFPVVWDAFVASKYKKL
ncbi:FAD-dependent thymidylate synthase [Kocuria massiliensis]|uniref:FAD-dependent thymidylate synthase n=1 Tax=Kocuria massiliensis TaxID=1926282 RepID=UPI0022B99124|nr:FAD-dependent thymidylate synthase [Kocuria massiliensis]